MLLQYFCQKWLLVCIFNSPLYYIENCICLTLVYTKSYIFQFCWAWCSEDLIWWAAGILQMQWPSEMVCMCIRYLSVRDICINNNKKTLVRQFWGDNIFEAGYKQLRIDVITAVTSDIYSFIPLGIKGPQKSCAVPAAENHSHTSQSGPTRGATEQFRKDRPLCSTWDICPLCSCTSAKPWHFTHCQ